MLEEDLPIDAVVERAREMEIRSDRPFDRVAVAIDKRFVRA
ncbi:hypothetical protein [Mesorhizobium sp. B2-6-2]|nr:hypothetical protein [Mesorhizobium sp. B2-6-2]